MSSRIVLWVDGEHVETEQRVNVDTGEVEHVQVSARELCESLGVKCTPMTVEAKAAVLYTPKTGKRAGVPVKLGDFGPFVLARLDDGQIQSGWGIHDLARPTRISAGTLRALAGIFGGGKAVDH